MSKYGLIARIKGALRVEIMVSTIMIAMVEAIGPIAFSTSAEKRKDNAATATILPAAKP